MNEGERFHTTRFPLSFEFRNKKQRSGDRGQGTRQRFFLKVYRYTEQTVFLSLLDTLTWVFYILLFFSFYISLFLFCSTAQKYIYLIQDKIPNGKFYTFFILFLFFFGFLIRIKIRHVKKAFNLWVCKKTNFRRTVP